MNINKISDQINPHSLPNLRLKAFWALDKLTSRTIDRFTASTIASYLIEKEGIPTSRQAIEYALSNNKSTCHKNKIGFKLMHDGLIELGKHVQRQKTQSTQSAKAVYVLGEYVNKKRFYELKKIKGKFDFVRLLEMLKELNMAFAEENYISVILLTRAILDHVPPIFGFNTFIELANNYTCAKSFKESMLNLENSSRKIADAYLHIKIRNKETLPNNTQVNFSHELDILLAEIIRIS